MRHRHQSAAQVYQLVLIAVSGLVLVSSCCGLHPVPEPLISDPAEMSQRLQGPPGDSAFFAEARVEYYGDGVARKGKMVLMAQAPDSLRIELLSFTDDLLSVLVLEGGEFQWFERGRKECLGGRLCAAPMVARFPMVSTPDRLIQVFRGQVPLLPEPERKELAFSREEGVYVLTLAQGNVEQQVRIAPDGKTVAGVRMLEGGRTAIDIELAGSLDVGGTTVPKRVRLKVPDDGLDLSVEFREFVDGAPWKGDPFEFSCPKGTVYRALDCLEE